MWIALYNNWISLDLWLLKLLTIFIWTLWLATMIWVQNIAFHILLKEIQSTDIKIDCRNNMFLGLIPRSIALYKTKMIQYFSFPYPWFYFFSIFRFFSSFLAFWKYQYQKYLSRTMYIWHHIYNTFWMYLAPWLMYVLGCAHKSGCGFWYLCGGKVLLEW